MKHGKRKTLLIGAIVLAVLIGALLGLKALNAYNEKKAEEREAAEKAEEEANRQPLEITTFRLMDGIEKEDVASVTWTWNGEENTIYRTADGWGCDKGVPLDVDFCNGVARAVAYTRAAQKLDMSGMTLEELGLTDPKMEISYTLQNGTTYNIHIGMRNAVLDQNYATVDGMDGVYLLSSNFESTLGKDLLDLAVIDTMPTINNVREIAVSGEVNLAFVSPENYEEYSYTSAYQNYLVDENGEYIEIDSGSVYEATNTLADEDNPFNWTDTVDYCADGVGMERYGLADPRLTVKVDYSTDVKDEEGNYTGSDDGTITLCFGDYANEDCTLIYARPENSSFVYTIDSKEYDLLAALRVENMLTQYVCLIEWDAMTNMDISVQGMEDVHFEIVRDGEGLAQEYRINGVSVPRETMRNLYYEIFSLKQDARVYDSARPVSDAYVKVVFTRSRDDQYAVMPLYLIPYNGDFYIADFNGMQQQLINKRTVDTFVNDLQAALAQLGA